MPYKRYDITNTYSYRGRRKNDNVVLKTVFLCLLPLIMAGVLFLGGYISYWCYMNENASAPVIPVEKEDNSEFAHEEELLTVVNENNPLDSDFVPELSESQGVQVSVLMADSLNKMIKDAKAQGIELKITEGYVSYDEQQKKYDTTFENIKKSGNLSQIRAEAQTKKVCPLAGCSESQTGLLIKFAVPEGEKAFDKTAEFRWLEKHAVSYGFILRYPEDKEAQTGLAYNSQIFRFVGKESAANIRRYDMTLDEYALHISIR